MQKIKNANSSHPFIVIIVIGFLVTILMRIPRISGPYGLDGFTLFWEAQKLLEGHYLDWYINPFTIVGAFPFSSYPIGSLFIMAFFILIFNQMETTIFVFSIILSVLTFISSYYLGTKLFKTHTYQLIFALIYTNAPTLLFFSYYTSSARLPLLTIVPLFLVLILELNKKFKLREFIFIIIILFLMFFLHRMSLIYLFFLFALFLGMIIPEKFKNKMKFDTSRVKTNIIAIVIIALIMYVIGLIIIPLGNLGAKNPLLFSTNDIYINIIIGDFTDALFNWGILPFFLPLGILELVNKTPFMESYFKKQCNYLFVIFLPLLIILSEPAFARLILLPMICLLATLGIIFIAKRLQNIHFLNLTTIFIVLFLFLYHFYWRPVEIYLILIVILMILVFVLNIRDDFRIYNYSINLSKNKIPGLFIVLFLFFSLFIIDSKSSLVVEGPILPYMSDEEEAISQYLNKFEPKMFTAYSNVIEQRIAAKSGWLTLRSIHYVSLLIVNYYNKSQIEANAQLKPIHKWIDPELFTRNIAGEELFNLLMSNTTRVVKWLVNKLTIRFFISLINSTNYEVSGTIFNSIFIQDLFDNHNPVFQTKNFNVWDLTNITGI